jgi:hypothetical protein
MPSGTLIVAISAANPDRSDSTEGARSGRGWLRSIVSILARCSLLIVVPFPSRCRYSICHGSYFSAVEA